MVNISLWISVNSNIKLLLQSSESETLWELYSLYMWLYDSNHNTKLIGLVLLSLRVQYHFVMQK